MGNNSNASGGMEKQLLASLTLAADRREQSALPHKKHPPVPFQHKTVLGPGFGLDGLGKGQNIRWCGVSGSVIVTNHYLDHLRTVRYARNVARPEAIRNRHKLR